MIGSAAVQTAIEYEYRFTEYRPPRRTEYEYDEIRCEARTALQQRLREQCADPQVLVEVGRCDKPFGGMDIHVARQTR